MDKTALIDKLHRRLEIPHPAIGVQAEGVALIGGYVFLRKLTHAAPARVNLSRY
ncbi:MAG: hypothetical protein M5U05_11395 [Anaerolineales bacterium]|nr:hypothetical protein [Anaerolineales bacterium]